MPTGPDFRYPNRGLLDGEDKPGFAAVQALAPIEQSPFAHSDDRPPFQGLPRVGDHWRAQKTGDPITDIVASLPEAVDLPMDPSVMHVLETLWGKSVLSYDWNPQRIALRNASRRVYRLTRFGEYLVLTCPGPNSDQAVSLLWGQGESRDLLSALAGRTMVRASRDTVESIEPEARSQLNTFRARSFDEYVYDVIEQHCLKGKKFGRRRTYLRALQRSADSVEVVDLDLTDAADVRAVRRLSDEWQDDRGAHPTIADERAALEVLLASSSMPPRTHAVGVRADGELIGYAVYDLLDSTVATAHFVKARRSGAAVASTWNALFTAAHRVGATHLNGGYDGGDAGLRAAKLGLQPCQVRSGYYILPIND